MNNKEQSDTAKSNEKLKQRKKYNGKISGLDIDKIEYQEIVLSYSNRPDRKYYD